jgi:hypothetical protein
VLSPLVLQVDPLQGFVDPALEQQRSQLSVQLQLMLPPRALLMPMAVQSTVSVVSVLLNLVNVAAISLEEIRFVVAWVVWATSPLLKAG